MKTITVIYLLVCSLLLTACNGTSVGVIGAADGPTGIYISDDDGSIRGQFGVQYEKKAIKMFNINGDLYYDSGLVSNTPLRGVVMDGEFIKTVEENEIPLKSGEANFEADGYKNATDITKKVKFDNKWLIFKKYDAYEESLDGLKYCYYIKGHLNNAAIDTEIIALSEYEDVTFNDIYDPMLSSQFTVGSANGKLHYNILSTDEWGITLYYDKLTPSRIRLKFEQFGDISYGRFLTGDPFWIEVMEDGKWKSADMTKEGKTAGWAGAAYEIKKNDVTYRVINWEIRYGKLSPGFYRIKKEVSYTRIPGEDDTKVYEVYFSIE